MNESTHCFDYQTGSVVEAVLLKARCFPYYPVRASLSLWLCRADRGQELSLAFCFFCNQELIIRLGNREFLMEAF